MQYLVLKVKPSQCLETGYNNPKCNDVVNGKFKSSQSLETCTNRTSQQQHDINMLCNLKFNIFKGHLAQFLLIKYFWDLDEKW